MKANILLKKILMELAAKKHKFAQETLENGTILEAEAFAAGNEIFIVTDEERIPLPVGDYVLADGRALKVEEEGLIASVDGAAESVEAEDMPSEEGKKIDAEEEVVVEAPEEIVSEVQAVVEAVIEVVAPLIEEVKAEMEEIKEEMKKYKKMSKQSSTKTIKHNPTSKPKVSSITMSEGRAVNTTLDRVLSRLSR